MLHAGNSFVRPSDSRDPRATAQPDRCTATIPFFRETIIPASSCLVVRSFNWQIARTQEVYNHTLKKQSQNPDRFSGYLYFDVSRNFGWPNDPRQRSGCDHQHYTIKRCASNFSFSSQVLSMAICAAVMLIKLKEKADVVVDLDSI